MSISWMFSPAPVLADPEQKASLLRLFFKQGASISFQENGGLCLVTTISRQGKTAWTAEIPAGWFLGKSALIRLGRFGKNSRPLLLEDRGTKILSLASALTAAGYSFIRSFGQASSLPRLRHRSISTALIELEIGTPSMSRTKLPAQEFGRIDSGSMKEAPTHTAIFF